MPADNTGLYAATNIVIVFYILKNFRLASACITAKDTNLMWSKALLILKKYIYSKHQTPCDENVTKFH